jgi:hypothetical protein
VDSGSFWRWFDRAARLDFASNVVGWFWDWRPWALSGLGALIAGVLSKLDGWPNTAIFLATISAGLIVAVVYAVLRFAFALPGPNAAQVGKLAANERASLISPDWPLRDLFHYLAPNLPLRASSTGNVRVDDLDSRWKEIGEKVIKQLSLGTLHASGRQHRGPRRYQASPIPAEFWRDAKFTYWFLDEDGTDNTHAANGSGTSYANIEVSRLDSLRIWPGPGDNDPLQILLGSGDDFETRQSAGLYQTHHIFYMCGSRTVIPPS